MFFWITVAVLCAAFIGLAFYLNNDDALYFDDSTPEKLADRKTPVEPTPIATRRPPSVIVKQQPRKVAGVRSGGGGGRSGGGGFDVEEVVEGVVDLAIGAAIVHEMVDHHDASPSYSDSGGGYDSGGSSCGGDSGCGGGCGGD